MLWIFNGDIPILALKWLFIFPLFHLYALNGIYLAPTEDKHLIIADNLVRDSIGLQPLNIRTAIFNNLDIIEVAPSSCIHRAQTGQ